MEEGTADLDSVVLNKKVEEMEAEVEKLEKVLQAKKAVLEDVLCSINLLPRHPRNAALIANVLHSRIKQPETLLDGFNCHIIWTVLFLEYICVAIEIRNSTPKTILPSCAAFCSSDMSDTVTVIFDELKTSHSIPPMNKRKLVTSFQKGLLLSGQVNLVLDCEILDVSNSNIDLALLPLLPKTNRDKQTQIVKVFEINEPLKKFSLDKVDDLSLKEGMELYQCLYTCYFSELLDIAPSRVRSILRRIDKFVEADFGDWQLFIGAAETIWNDYIVFINSAFVEDSCALSRIFAKSERDAWRMKQILTDNDKLLTM